jgi:hypothetical protein
MSAWRQSSPEVDRNLFLQIEKHFVETIHVEGGSLPTADCQNVRSLLSRTATLRRRKKNLRTPTQFDERRSRNGADVVGTNFLLRKLNRA